MASDFELGYGAAFSVYAVVSILSALVAPDKEAAMFFIMFLGFYPIIKGILEGKIKSKPIRILLKFALFNVCMVAAYFVGKFLLGIPDDSFVIFGVFLPYVFLALGNVFFIVYDYCITVIIIQYLNRLRPKVFKKK